MCFCTFLYCLIYFKEVMFLNSNNTHEVEVCEIETQDIDDMIFANEVYCVSEK